LAGCQGGGEKRVLFLGNSQIESWNLPRIVESLSASAPSACPRIKSFALTQGGTNLRDLWELLGAERAIRQGRYDAVVIAESLDLVAPPDDTYPGAFRTYANLMIDAAQSVGSKPLLYATPGTDSEARTSEFVGMANPQIELANERGVQVATGGLAWLRVWSSLPDAALFGPDASHPSYWGSTLSGLVLYAAIVDASPVGLTPNPVTDCDDGVCASIPSDVSAVFQRAALDEYLTQWRR
jgi:hypothetical protein